MGSVHLVDLLAIVALLLFIDVFWSRRWGTWPFGEARVRVVAVCWSKAARLAAGTVVIALGYLASGRASFEEFGLGFLVALVLAIVGGYVFALTNASGR
jgi:hypothetical protein